MGLGYTARTCDSPSEGGCLITPHHHHNACVEPILSHKDIQPGTHITAIGADRIGKQELDVEICARADLCVATRVRSAPDSGGVSCVQGIHAVPT